MQAENTLGNSACSWDAVDRFEFLLRRALKDGYGVIQKMGT